MTDKIITIGIGLILFGILLLIIGSLIDLTKPNTKTDIAVGGFIGPIPFGFFTEKRMFWVWLLILIVLIIFYFILKRAFI